MRRHLNRYDIFLLTFSVSASLVLSFFLMHRVDIINPDAICYLLAAEQMGTLGLKGAMHFCGQAGWPFYSLLIYKLVTFTHLTYPHAAYTLDAFFQALSVFIFLLITRELNASKRVLWFAACFILMAHEFNSVREYIIRDHGFWAFYLSSIYFLIRFFTTPRLSYALAWSASILIATLFRVEGALFLIAMPFLVFLLKDQTFIRKCKAFFQLNLLTLVLLFGMCCWLLTHAENRTAFFDRLYEVPQLQHGIDHLLARYSATKSALATHVLGPDSAKEAGAVFFILMISWYLFSVIVNLSFGYSFLVLYALWQRALILPNRLALVLFGYLSLNVIITLTFLFERMFLSKRYLIALSLVLMLWAPFGFEALLRKIAARSHQALTALVAIVITVSALGGILDFGYSKKYIYDAGSWVQNHIPKTAKLYTNDYQLMYYTQHFGDDIFKLLKGYMAADRLSDNQWQAFDYLALRLDKKNLQQKTRLAQLPIVPIQQFENKRGDKVVIFKVVLHQQTNVREIG